MFCVVQFICLPASIYGERHHNVSNVIGSFPDEDTANRWGERFTPPEHDWIVRPMFEPSQQALESLSNIDKCVCPDSPCPVHSNTYKHDKAKPFGGNNV